MDLKTKKQIVADLRAAAQKLSGNPIFYEAMRDSKPKSQPSYPKASKKLTPDQYRRKHYKCPPGYHVNDKERCVESEGIVNKVKRVFSGGVVSAEFREETVREVMTKHLPHMVSPSVATSLEALPEQLELPKDLLRAAEAFDLVTTDLLAEVAGEQEAKDAMDSGASVALFDYLDGSGSIADLRDKGIEDYQSVEHGIRSVAYEFRVLRNLIDETLKEGIFTQIEDWAANAADMIIALVEKTKPALPTGDAAKAMYLTALPGNMYGEGWQTKGKKMSFAQAVLADLREPLAAWAENALEFDYLQPGEVDAEKLSSVLTTALSRGVPEAKLLAAIEDASEVVLSEDEPKGDILSRREISGDLVVDLNVDVDVPSATGNVKMTDLVRLVNERVFMKHLSAKKFMADSRLLDMKPGQKTVQVWANEALDNKSFYVVVDTKKLAGKLGIQSVAPDEQEED